MNLKETYTFEELLKIMQILRSPNGCPWDREQNHESLKQYLIEETYEVLDAIDSKSTTKLVEELGDILLQVVFHSQIGKDEKTFTIDHVISTVSKKMVERHAHVFGDKKLETSQDVLNVWDSIKQREKGIETHTQMMKDIPNGMPALMRAFKVQQKASKVGFDWKQTEPIYNKIFEEIEEVKSACQARDTKKISDEIGDLLFAVVNLSRVLDTHPELSLSSTTDRFIQRFEYIEKVATQSGKKLIDMSLEEMDLLWVEAKQNLHGGNNEN